MNNDNVPPLVRLSTLEQEVQMLRTQIQDHKNVPFTQAHPRNGFPGEVLQYLGLDLEENVVVVVAPVPKDNRNEQTAENVV